MFQRFYRRPGAKIGNAPGANTQVVREHMKKLEKLAKETTKGQHEVAVGLGVSE